MNNDRIAILATGDEIIAGDILNTNTRTIAQQLTDHGIEPGLQMTVSDDQAEIEEAIAYLLERHAGLIISGGLGPTSDDRTRFALAAYLKQELVFDETSWQRIVNRLKNYGLDVPDNNRQQALFPEAATILPNDRGTASACYVEHNNKVICMLPGPPRELNPILEEQVLPRLIEKHFANPMPQKSWMLLGLSEGHLAAELDSLTESTEAIVGYRVTFPYIELKLRSHDSSLLSQLNDTILQRYGTHIVSTEKQTASERLRQYLATTQTQAHITDTATGGAIEHLLSSPETRANLHFNLTQSADTNTLQVHISGLEAIWTLTETAYTEAYLTLTTPSDKQTIDIKVPFRNPTRTRQTAAEMICWELLQYLQSRQT